MASIPYVGKVFPTAAGFLAYLEEIKFGAWRPRYVCAHHTGNPDFATWQRWQTRADPVTDAEWLANLAHYYATPEPGVKGAWDRGPHFFFTPNNYCVLTSPTMRGIHAASFNQDSWGVEMVGNYDVEKFDGTARSLRYIDGLACLHIAAGLRPDPYVRNRSGLHFHRDDPKTSKACPGKNVDKAKLVAAVKSSAAKMTEGDSPDDPIEAPTQTARGKGVVRVPKGETLNVRAAAGGKSPVIRKLANGAPVAIEGESRNGPTIWLDVGDGWVSAQFISRVL